MSSTSVFKALGIRLDFDEETRQRDILKLMKTNVSKNRTYCCGALLSLAAFLFLGGAIAMLVVSDLNKWDYDNLEVHSAENCNLYNGWIEETEYSIYAIINASLIHGSGGLVWGRVQENQRSEKNAWAFVNASMFSTQVCYYIPEKLNFESQDNLYLLNYNRDEYYRTYVALAVVGSIFLAICVTALVGAIIGCCRAAKAEKNKAVPLSST